MINKKMNYIAVAAKNMAERVYENIWQYLKARMQNYAFWISIIAQVTLLLTLFGIKVDDQWVMKVAQTILGLLGILGILNNPTTTNLGYGDDKT